MILLLLLLLAGGGYAVYASTNSSGNTVTDPFSEFSVSGNAMSLPDIDPALQGGKWSRQYDFAFVNASKSLGVPFALLKAHAIRESALKAEALRIEPSGKASYGLMQVLWWANSNRFNIWGYSDDRIGDGSLLYDPDVNCYLASQIILDNWNSYGNLRDTINAYNTGKKESVRVAPGNYVDDVLKYYSTLIKRSVS